MSLSASAFIAESLLKGVFDVFDAMTGKQFSYDVQDHQPVTADVLEALLPNYPLVLRGRRRSGGAVGLMMSLADAARLAALVEGSEEAPATIDEQALLGVMREVAEPCLGAGVTNLLEKAGKNPEQPQGISTDLLGAEHAQSVLEFFSAAPKAVPFSYSADTFDGNGYLLITEELEQLVPSDLREQEATPLDSSTPKGQISEAEVNDILGGFGPTAQDAIATVNEHKRGHSNLELVLDIRLVATARLGRIEMPIGDILALGPGSIIDVGRLVDEPVELLVNNKLIARGDVVVVDEKFGLRITEIISPKERIESMH